MDQPGGFHPSIIDKLLETIGKHGRSQQMAFRTFEADGVGFSKRHFPSGEGLSNCGDMGAQRFLVEPDATGIQLMPKNLLGM